ncbi:MAG: hypothetical protein SWH68_13205 [Thermodesulfobacteriota bacterium]|nr:hypothetical protein [Thermodesulfobacteriota bacterium]
MKHYKLMVLALAVLLCGAFTAWAAGGPKAVVDLTDYTFSPVPEGTEVKHDFILQNKGDEALKVERVHTG